jgi:Kef-type K+ transport system membrane component KefB
MLDYELSRFLLSLVLILFFSLSVGHVFSVLGLPRLIGEICAGLILGPSLLGFFAPDLYAWIFSGFPEQQKLLSVFYWLGLIFLMFTAGFKITTSFLRQDFKLVGMLISGGIVLPFIFGLLATGWFQNTLSANSVAFTLVIACASAVTSIPVITRIFLDLNMLSGRFARIILSAAAIQDVFLWVILSVALTIQVGQGGQPTDFYDIGLVVVATFFFAVVAMFMLPAILPVAGRLALKGSPDASLIGYTLLVCLILVSLASVLQVNIIFGALLAGVVIGRLPGARLETVKQNITNMALWFFVPIYFAMVGLQMNLPGNFEPILIFGFLLASSLVKIASVTFAARFGDVPWRRAIDFGVTMNARGGPGIVLASMAYGAHIIDQALFVALVLASIFTSLAAGIWLRLRRDSLAG